MGAAPASSSLARRSVRNDLRSSTHVSEPPERVPPPTKSDRVQAAYDAIEVMRAWPDRLTDVLKLLVVGVAYYGLVTSAVYRWSLPLVGQIAALAVFFVPLAMLIYTVGKRPDTMLAQFRALGLEQPLMFAIGLWVAALGWFAAFAFVLVERDAVAFQTPDGAVESPSQLFVFFVWHSVDQIPALNINQTLHWDAPLQYSGIASLVVLGFRLVLVLALVPLVLAAWRHLRTPPDNDPH